VPTLSTIEFEPKSPGELPLLRRRARLLSRNPNHEEFPIVGLLDSDALVIAAIIGAHEQLLPGIARVLQHELLVRPIHTKLHGVLAASFHTGEPGETIPAADFHRQRLLCRVHDHGRQLGCHRARRELQLI